MVLPVAAAASRQAGFGTKIEKWEKERQKENCQDDTSRRAQSQVMRTRGTAPIDGRIRHKPAAFYDSFLFFDYLK
jgi:hypothetical protein